MQSAPKHKQCNLRRMLVIQKAHTQGLSYGLWVVVVVYPARAVQSQNE